MATPCTVGVYDTIQHDNSCILEGLGLLALKVHPDTILQTFFIALVRHSQAQKCLKLGLRSIFQMKK